MMAEQVRPEVTDEVRPGTRVGDFTVAYLISRGMSADVFAVWHRGLLTPLVCKRLRPSDAADGKRRRLLRAEGAALARLKHPGIVRFIGQEQRAELPYILSEHVGDRTLRDALREEGAFEPARAVRIMQHVCAAIAHAHGRGYLHRDLKPSNVVLRAGRPVVLDFGVVWKLAANRKPPDRSGTPQYLAPEQIKRDVLSPATDVYGLGALLYELITGERPFRRGDEGERASLAEKYPQLVESPKRIKRRGVSRELEAVIRRCLARDPSDRYAGARELAAALDPFTPVKIWAQPSQDGISSDPFR